MQVFQVKKVVGAAAGKIFAMKVLKKVHFFLYFTFRQDGNTILLLSLQFRVMYSCSQSVSCGHNDCTLVFTNKHHGASCLQILAVLEAGGGVRFHC